MQERFTLIAGASSGIGAERLAPADAARCKKTMGPGNHRIARAETAASDYTAR
jgi:hypothetical protein